MSTQRIGFIGTGVMGSGMIRNLQKAGYPVNINTRTKAKAEKLIQEAVAGSIRRQNWPPNQTSSLPWSAIPKM